jgi:hypothetical protein
VCVCVFLYVQVNCGHMHRYVRVYTYDKLRKHTKKILASMYVHMFYEAYVHMILLSRVLE